MALNLLSAKSVRHVLLAVLVGLLSSCDRSSTGPSQRDQPLKFLCIAPSMDDETWGIFQAGAHAFMKKFPSIQIEVVASQTRSPSIQIELLKSARARQVQAVCILPVDPLAVRTAVSEISTAGIPIVVIGWDVPGQRRDAYCGPSQMELGRAAAQACERILRQQSKTVMLLHAGMDHELFGRRYHGFKQEAPFAGPLEIIREVDCGADRFEAVKLVKAESRRYPRIGCWVFLEDWPLRALGENERLLPLGVTIVLCDAHPRHWPRLETGEIQALIGYDLHEATEAAYFRAIRLATGEAGRLEPEVILPSEIITIKELPEWRSRWETWQMGHPSPKSP